MAFLSTNDQTRNYFTDFVEDINLKSSSTGVCDILHKHLYLRVSTIYRCYAQDDVNINLNICDSLPDSKI